MAHLAWSLLILATASWPWAIRGACQPDLGADKVLWWIAATFGIAAVPLCWAMTASEVESSSLATASLATLLANSALIWRPKRANRSIGRLVPTALLLAALAAPISVSAAVGDKALAYAFLPCLMIGTHRATVALVGPSPLQIVTVLVPLQVVGVLILTGTANADAAAFGWCQFALAVAGIAGWSWWIGLPEARRTQMDEGFLKIEERRGPAGDWYNPRLGGMSEADRVRATDERA